MTFDDAHHHSHTDMECKDFVELITAYLDEALLHDVQTRIDEHLDRCDGCQNVLAQWRTIITLAGQLTETDVNNTDEITRDQLTLHRPHRLRRR